MTLMNIDSQECINEKRRTRIPFNVPPKESRRKQLLSGNLKRLTELEHLEVLGKTFPNGCLFRFQIMADILDMDEAPNFWEHLHLSYASYSWERISNIPLADAMRNSMLLFDKIHHDDLTEMSPLLHHSLIYGAVFNAEFRYRYTNTDIRWYQITMQPRRDGHWMVCDGLLHDITTRKKNEIELSLYRRALEPLIKEHVDELKAAKEELTTIKKELERKNFQLHNEILTHMKVAQQLENCKKSENFN